MQRRVRRLAGLVTLAGVALTVSVPAAQATPANGPPLAAAVKRSLDRLVAAGAPGAVVLVRAHERTLDLAAGYANTRTKTRMRASDRFRVGSVTKTFVATVILQLAGEGRLSLDDSVERWVSERLRNDSNANANLPRLARLAEVWEKIARAARDTADYNLERKPFVFSVFSQLAEATR